MFARKSVKLFVVIELFCHLFLFFGCCKTSFDGVVAKLNEFLLAEVTVFLGFFEIAVHIASKVGWVVRIDSDREFGFQTLSNDITVPFEVFFHNFQAIIAVRASSQRDFLFSHLLTNFHIVEHLNAMVESLYLKHANRISHIRIS